MRNYKLLINDKWQIAKLTQKEHNTIVNELTGKCLINAEFPITLLNGEVVDLGIIDGIKPTAL